MCCLIQIWSSVRHPKVSNLLPVRLYYAARDHICELCIRQQFLHNLGSLEHQLLLLYHLRPANRPAMTGVALCHKRVRNSRPEGIADFCVAPGTRHYGQHLSPRRREKQSLRNAWLQASANEVDQKCALPGYYAAISGNTLPTLREKLSVQSSGIDSLKMGPIGCPETSVRNYHYSLHNNPE